MVADLLRRQRQPSRFGLAVFQPLRRCLDTVIDRIAHQVHQRLGQRFHQRAIQLGVLAFKQHLNLLVQRT